MINDTGNDQSSPQYSYRDHALAPTTEDEAASSILVHILCTLKAAPYSLRSALFLAVMNDNNSAGLIHSLEQANF